MKLSNLEPISFDSVDWGSYDVYFFASGFEQRSTFVFESSPGFSAPLVVLGFSDHLDTLNRKFNDNIFMSRGHAPVIAESSTGYEKIIQTALQQAASAISMARPIRIFVDYSVMTRSWYGYILTWIKYSAACAGAQVDFFYSHGCYEKDFEELHIRELSSVPGFEGACAGARRTVALFGLGFDKYATLAVYDQIEPDSVVCFIAQDRVDDPHAEKVLSANNEILNMANGLPVRAPLSDVQEVFRLLYEQVMLFDASDEVVVVPMGPKTHVLTSLFLAQVVPRVTCLHALGDRFNPVPVSATGKVSATRAIYD
jgi:hypothetical protein